MEVRTRSYLRLIKPGITLSNTLSAVAGFFLAVSMVSFRLSVFIGAVVGIAFIIASACVVNNVLDRDIDKRMKRTAGRDVATGLISVPKALVFATLLGLIGFASILIYTNSLTFLLGVGAYLWYIVIYGLAKRTTALSTVIGGVAGALPPAAGYTALTGHIDSATIILFLLFFLWQMPHFYAIAMFRLSDYRQAKLPVWALSHGMKSTKRQIMLFVILFAICAALLTLFGYTGVTYVVGSLALSIYWLLCGILNYRKLDDIKWARKMFGASLLVLLGMCVLISVGGYLL